MDLRTDRLGLLLDQHDSAVDFTRDRFAGLTDEECRWEPAQPAWSIRRRGEATSPAAFGRGDWVLDHESDPDPPPVTTIAWRLGHLVGMYAGRWEWTFGGRSEDPKTLTAFTPWATEALDALWTKTDRWRADAATLTDEQLDTVGLCRYPYGRDSQLPFIGILWWMNKELIHHSAEIALLRDLYRARGDSAG